MAYSGAAFEYSANPVRFDYLHNPRNELADADRYVGTTLDFEYDYAYDPIGNRLTYTTDADPDPGNPVARTYARNSLNQYQSVATGPGQQQLDYDADGNLVEMRVSGDMNCDGTVTFDDIAYFSVALGNESAWVQYYKDRHSGQEPPCSWLNGDFNSGGGVESGDIKLFAGSLGTGGLWAKYVWDAENRLTEVRPMAPDANSKRVEFVYDYQGRRVAKRVYDWVGPDYDDWATAPSDVRKFVWDGWLMLLELDGTDQVVRKYTWGLDLAGQNGSPGSREGVGGIGGLLAMEAPQTVGDPLKYVYEYDANGNVGQLVDWSHDPNDPAGAIVARYEYDPYGNVTASAGSYADANPIRFSTKYFDAETGLGYWGYRYYSPSLGRWISRDRAAETGGANLYAYVRNVPAATVDSLGLWPFGGSPAENPQPAAQTKRGAGCCGPDVTNSLARFLKGVESFFLSRDKKVQMRMCRTMVSEFGWDIDQLFASGAQGGFGPFESNGCGTGGCAGTVRVHNRCVRSNELNYILWGKLNALCRGTMASWTTWRVVLGPNGPEFQAYDLDGWPVPLLAWTLTEAATLTQAHRAVGARAQRIPPNAVGEGSAGCRVAWTKVGYSDDWSSIDSCVVEGCGLTCCNQDYDFNLTGYAGTGSDRVGF